MKILSEAEILRRRPVWQALSLLWLDNEVSGFYNHIVEVLQQSAYSIDSLEQIYLLEVGPVVYTNLLQVAGEWQGFDSDWLEKRIMERLNKTGPTATISRWLLRVPFRFLIDHATRDDWQIIRQRLLLQ